MPVRKQQEDRAGDGRGMTGYCKHYVIGFIIIIIIIIIDMKIPPHIG
jgi:heme/copper-type cytochrome/quinol oxidase subunit 4